MVKEKDEESILIEKCHFIIVVVIIAVVVDVIVIIVENKARPISTPKKGSRHGVVVRAFASQQCDPGFDSRTRSYNAGRVCCWLSSLLREVFPPGKSGFPHS